MDSHDRLGAPDSALTLLGIRALHDRLNELERRVAPDGPPSTRIAVMTLSATVKAMTVTGRSPAPAVSPEHPDAELKRLLASHPAPAQSIEADPPGHGGEPAAQVLDGETEVASARRRGRKSQLAPNGSLWSVGISGLRALAVSR